MRHGSKLAIAAVAGVLYIGLGVPQKAAAGGPLVIPATEFTQILNHIQLLFQYEQQVQQYSTQLQQYQTQLKNAATLPTQSFGPIQQDLMGLQQSVQGGQAISYAMGNLDSQFTSKFGGYGYHPTQNYAQDYANLAQTSLDSTQHALDAAGLQSSQFSTEQGLLDQLNTMSQSSDGQLQAVQVGNQIASEQIQQLMKLRELMMADMQSKAAFQATQTQMAATQTSDVNGFFQAKPGGIGVQPAAQTSAGGIVPR